MEFLSFLCHSHGDPIKNPMTPCFRRINEVSYVADFMVTDRHTHTHTQNDYCNPMVHVPRVNQKSLPMHAGPRVSTQVHTVVWRLRFS